MVVDGGLPRAETERLAWMGRRRDSPPQASVPARGRDGSAIATWRWPGPTGRGMGGPPGVTRGKGLGESA